ncbi:PREDICTED: hydrolethalus syndrome protein 1 [Chaetura pelagica]|uniref:hydrolethalus syndrome protein 1 n=1 Tax=Chaetura pelagica TaxID=8897 RepID=UPI000523EA52|nr:PREDICTED: hydrolethalus syndrome protein 1 [Chaetura pelagica]
MMKEAGKGGRRLVMKRKVLRHRPDGSAEVWNESVSSEPESGTRNLIHPGINPEDDISEGEMETSSSFLEEPSRQWPRGDRSTFLLGHFRGRSLPISQDTTSTTGQPKSFIPPHFQLPSRGKSDPVTRYLEYKRNWEKFCIPGETQRQELCWSVREQMRCKPQPPKKPQPQPVPNKYIVPTQKKRSSLCWEVRWALAHGLLPPKYT